LTKTYLALGDSMSIDDYTGQEGGGAVSQLYQSLPAGWSLVDKTVDGCVMQLVPTGLQGDLITLTIGGNDLLGNLERFLMTGDEEELAPETLDLFASEHRQLLESLRSRNPNAVFVVGNIYRPDIELPPLVDERLAVVNRTIAENAAKVGARLADLHRALEGRAHTHLTKEIEPNLKGATAIAEAFRAAIASEDRRALGLEWMG